VPPGRLGRSVLNGHHYAFEGHGMEHVRLSNPVGNEPVFLATHAGKRSGSTDHYGREHRPLEADTRVSIRPRGNSFEIVDYASHTGNFGTINGLSVANSVTRQPVDSTSRLDLATS